MRPAVSGAARPIVAGGLRVAAQRPAARRRKWRLDATGLLGGVLLAVIVVACLAAPLLTRADPLAVDLLRQFEGPSRAHPFGTDNFGRDLLARVLYGGRVSLAVAALATATVLLISTALGTLAGYCGGALDALVTRLADLTLAFPRLVLAIAIAGLLGAGLPSVAIAIVAVSWATYARLVRGMTLQLREEGYVAAARALGAGPAHLIRRHLLPGLAGRVAVLVTLDFGYLILNVSSLSFLGLGVRQPTPEWGAMLNEGRLFFAGYPQLMLYPGLAIFLTVLAANLLGDALRDALDPLRAKR
jgi:ABC-type dipeptide/oligopeptide/nickel transport system permease subunit